LSRSVFSSFRQFRANPSRLFFFLFFPTALFAQDVPAEISSPALPAHELAADKQPEPKRYLIAEPVVDLRREPRGVLGTASLRQPYEADPLQETQLLFGEEVEVKEEKGGWLRVAAVEQLEFSHNQVWEGYPGWIPKLSVVPKPERYNPNAVVQGKYAPLYAAPKARRPAMQLPLGARVNILFQDRSWVRVERPGQADGWMRVKHLRHLTDLSKDEVRLRESILKTARLFLKEPYYWGGRCSHRPDVLEHPTGVDCSALVNLAYRVNWIDVPRDAHEQYMKSKPVLLPDLRPADLIFLAHADNPHRVTHVMLYLGGDHVIEAVQEHNVVRIVSVKEKLGVALRDVRAFEPAGGRFVYFGRLVAPD
jgi:gamma-D-glutamyl-L-lysine dipeptidyl-peptidase